MGTLAAGDRVADRYEILRELGKGAMGRVFLAHDTKFKQQVALKVGVQRVGPHSALFRTRFEREARIGHQLGKTPGFVRALDWGETRDGQLYLAMDPIVSAKPLDLKRGPQRDRLRQVLEAARLVAECHRQGIVHRDIKPGNFLVDPEGQVHLTDFGLAKTRQDQELPEELADGAATQTGVAVGTPVYMPPEQFVDAKTADERADVYALGVMLFKVLTGQPPFRTPISNLLLQQEEVRAGKKRPPRPRDHDEQVPRGLDDLVARAVAVEPDVRPSAATLVQALERELDYAPTIPDGRRSSSRRRRASSDRQTAVRRSSSGRQKTVQSTSSAAVRSYTPAPSRWERWAKRLGRLTWALALIGVPLGLAGVLVLDVGGVQAFLPKHWHSDLGQLTARAYRALPAERAKLLDVQSPRIELVLPKGQTFPWTPSEQLELKLDVRDGCLTALRVNGTAVPVSAEAKWRQRFTVRVPLPQPGEHTVVIEATDWAEQTTKRRVQVWRVDRLFADITARRTADGVAVQGRLRSPLTLRVHVGEAQTTATGGELAVTVPAPDEEQLRLKATSPSGEETVRFVPIRAD